MPINLTLGWLGRKSISTTKSRGEMGEAAPGEETEEGDGCFLGCRQRPSLSPHLLSFGPPSSLGD